MYRPGSTSVTAAFFTELGDVLDSLATSTDPIVLAGDVNIRLERTADPHAVEFSELLDGYELVQHVSGMTHDAGGTLDVVCTRDDLPSPVIDVIDIGLSDHRLTVVVSTTPSTNLRHVNAQIVEVLRLRGRPACVCSVRPTTVVSARR